MTDTLDPHDEVEKEAAFRALIAGAERELKQIEEEAMARIDQAKIRMAEKRIQAQSSTV